MSAGHSQIRVPLKTHLYKSVAIFVASAMLRQSISQKRAETVVVNDTQSLTNVNGVEPVTSSHWARDGPPGVVCRNLRPMMQEENIIWRGSRKKDRDNTVSSSVYSAWLDLD